MTQNNLGNALTAQAGRTEGAEAVRLLAEAVSAYREALGIFTIESFPNYHATVSRNLQKNETDLQKLKPKAP